MAVNFMITRYQYSWQKAIPALGPARKGLARSSHAAKTPSMSWKVLVTALSDGKKPANMRSRCCNRPAAGLS